VKVLSWEAVFGTGFFGTIDLDRNETEGQPSETPATGMDLQHERLAAGGTVVPEHAHKDPEAEDC
jgi:hypothetical protein